MKPTQPDVLVERHENLFLFHALYDDSMEWIVEHVPPGSMFYNGALVVEVRHAWDLAQGMVEDGFTVE